MSVVSLEEEPRYRETDKPAMARQSTDTRGCVTCGHACTCTQLSAHSSGPDQSTPGSFVFPKTCRRARHGSNFQLFFPWKTLSTAPAGSAIARRRLGPRARASYKNARPLRPETLPPSPPSPSPRPHQLCSSAPSALPPRTSDPPLLASRPAAAARAPL